MACHQCHWLSISNEGALADLDIVHEQMVVEEQRTAGLRRMRGGICAGVGRKPPMNQKNADATNQHMMMPCQLSASFCCSTAKAEAAMLVTEGCGIRGQPSL